MMFHKNVRKRIPQYSDVVPVDRPARSRTAGARWRLVAAVMSCLVACGHGEPPTDAGDPGIGVINFAPGQGAVHGYVDATVPAAIALPDATVQLRRVSDGVTTSAVTTDVHGGFTASGVPVGTYVICLSGTAGFMDACSATSFVVTSAEIAYPPHAAFSPVQVIVHGRVRLGDNTDVRYENDLFDKAVDTFVKAVTPDGGLAAGPVRVNGHGEYLLRALSSKTSYRIVVTSETTTVETLVLTGGAPVVQDFLLPNRRPAVEEVNALQGGVGVHHAAPGSIVRVEARASDPDGQPLHYQWLAPRGGSCPPTDAAAVDCTMPAAAGLQSIYVQVADGAGQYAVGLASPWVRPSRCSRASSSPTAARSSPAPR
jgi:hypothetical protein